MGEKKLILHRPTQGERLGQFAASHFTISAVGAILAIPSVFLLGTINCQELSWSALALGALIMLLAYVFFGVRAAKKGDWSGPKNILDGFLAFLFPALIAWAWGSLMLCFVGLPGPTGWEIMGLLFPVNFLCAFPSTLMVVFALVLGFLDGGLPNMIVCMLFVGSLPPLLYLLGSIWGSRKGKRYVETSNEEEE